MFLKKYIGDKAFYRTVLGVSVPIMVQNGITNFVSLLDNIMVGTLGTEEMSGVSIVNQFIFVFNILIFGAVSAAGIFTAQYHGFGDNDGVRHTFCFKFLTNVVVALFAVLAFACFDDALISLFLHDGSTEGDLVLTLERGKEYLRMILIGMVPYAISQVYASNMRETGQAVLPMIASIAAVITNFVLNLVLIFGYCGFPALGVVGAAIATVVSRFVELFVLVIWGHTHTDRCPYLVGAFRSFRIPRPLFRRIVMTGLPLMFNELLWSLSVTMRNQCYSTRGLDVVAAQNINSTIVNLFNVVYLALGSSIGIVVGNLLGAGKLEEAKDTNRRMIFFSVTCATGMGVILAAIAAPYTWLYEPTAAVREIAIFMIAVSAITMPLCAYAHASYFTLRTGGRVFITFLLDSGYMWVLVVPLTTILAYFSDLGIREVFIVGQAAEAAKCLLAWILLKRGTWAKQLVSDEEMLRD
ncbi:MAG: MATE family efflux transporter [Clostridia bacterium]|nr:MATE family efflux transporter [Clostridia bacterium]